MLYALENGHGGADNLRPPEDLGIAAGSGGSAPGSAGSRGSPAGRSRGSPAGRSRGSLGGQRGSGASHPARRLAAWDRPGEASAKAKVCFVPPEFSTRHAALINTVKNRFWRRGAVCADSDMHRGRMTMLQSN